MSTERSRPSWFSRIAGCSLLSFAGGVALVALNIFPQAADAQDSHLLVGIWSEAYADGKWEWEITKVGGQYQARGLTNQHAGNHANLASFDGTTAKMDFWDNGYEGTIEWEVKTGKGAVIFSKKPSDSAQVIGRRNPISMVRVRPVTPPNPSTVVPDTVPGTPPQLPPPPGPGPAGPGNGPGGLQHPSQHPSQPPSQPPVRPHTWGDALSALKMAVRLIPENLSLDVTGEGSNSGPDGKVTARDAQVIAQRATSAVQRP